MVEDKDKARDSALPLTKIRTIMKCSPDIELVSSDSLSVVGKATELFVQHFITLAYIHSRDKRNIGYADVAMAVENEENLSFLSDVLPRKRLAGECIDFDKLTDRNASTVDIDPGTIN